MILIVSVCSSCIHKRQLVRKPMDQDTVASVKNILPVCYYCGRPMCAGNLTEVHVSPTNYVKWALIIGFVIGVLIRWIF